MAQHVPTSTAPAGHPAAGQAAPHRRQSPIGKFGRLPLALAALLVVFLGVIILHGPLARQLHAWKLLPEPERLTELYYTDHIHLPTSYTPGVTQQFGFTVHNIEYRTVRYQYEVSQISEDHGQQQTLAQGNFSLTQDSYHTQNVSITPTDLGPRSQITTQISIPASNSSQPSNNEMLHYWVARITEGP